MKMTGAQIIVETLIEQGIDTVFGYPGGCVINIYDELFKNQDRIHHYLTCHEQGAAHSADAYARVTGKPGVVIATSGPGATNLVTGIATAYLDSSPIVAITGNVIQPLIGKDSFQEVDIAGVTMPITKHNYIVKDIEKLADTIREALRIAISGRPGPVLVDIPKDIQVAMGEFIQKDKVVKNGSSKLSDESIESAAELIKSSERPYIYAGGGVVISDASSELLEFANKIDAPIGLSMMGLTSIPGTNPRNLGMTGMHGRYAASKAMSESDLIIAIGTRFSDRATGSKPEFIRGKKFLHIDIDPAEIGKNIPAYVSVIGDVKQVLTRLNALLPTVAHPEWDKVVKALKSSPENKPEPSEGRLAPKTVIEAVRALMKDDDVVATDVGQHQMWVSQFYSFDSPRTFITSGGLGTMGFGMGAAMGSSIGRGKKRTVLFTGDGSFHMNLNELATAVTNELPIIIVVMNNSVLGMVRQWQTLFFDKRYASTTLNRKTDFVKLAEAFGATGLRVSEICELSPVLEKAFSAKGPVVIDVKIDSDEKVLPMIPPGGTINDIILKG
jgi:acetolactate synthase, large subunit, biosynthetic type